MYFVSIRLGRRETFAFMLPWLVGRQTGKPENRVISLAKNMETSGPGRLLLVPYNEKQVEK